MSKDRKSATKCQLVLVCLLEGLITVYSSNISYANVGDDIIITCPSVKVYSWTFVNTGEILAFCNGKNQINTNSSISSRLFISLNCSLRISKFKKEDVGIYQCSHPSTTFNGMKSHNTNIQLRKIRIEGVDESNTLQRTEGENITLKCISEGVTIDGILYWKSDEVLLKSGKPPILNYAFTLKPTDHMKYYTCGANSSYNSYSLAYRVQLVIILKPIVLIRVYINSVQVTKQKSVIVKEGDKIELLCQLLKGYVGRLTWSHNMHNLSNSTNNKLTFERIKLTSTGMFICTVINSAGQDSDSINVSVEHTPVVKNTSQMFFTGDKPRILKCKVSGVPNIFKFNKWRHLVNGHLVRYLEGNNDGTVTLPYNNTSDIQYDDSGLYICNVTNGIRNENRQLWQTGTVNVSIRDQPVLIKPHKPIYIVQNISTTSVALYLLSSSEISAAHVSSQFDGNGNIKKAYCAAATVNTVFHGTHVNVSGYVCNLLITKTEGEDFKNFSVRVSNNCCSKVFKISIMSARIPVKPTVLEFTSSNTSIYVLLEPGWDGGIHQEFIIEYRKQQDKMWNSLLVKTFGTSRVRTYIPLLDPRTEYDLRIFARNAIGNSSLTDTYSMWTKDRPEMPRNVQVLTLEVKLIVKWKAGKGYGMRQTFIVEYREGFKQEWNVVPAVDDTTVVLEGLQAETVYYVRLFALTSIGDSNKTDEIIVKTGSRPVVIHKYFWKIGVITGSVVVGFLLCLYGIKAVGKRVCLNIELNRNNTSQGNATTLGTLGGQYDEIDSVYYNATNVNGSPDLTLGNTSLEILLSPSNRNHVVNTATSTDDDGNVNEQGLSLYGTAINISATDNETVESSSEDSYIIPRNNTNLELVINGEHMENTREQDSLTDGSSASNSEISETQINSAHQYETLSTTNIEVHAYDIPIETSLIKPGILSIY